ncbi:hypothetical protein JTE90_001049 [Oedothorax gibbosus]|uniref:Uncharacterized protein n=1 Tax=Oedothorax gibbosus TaxID=931172 RepID=A0AAV6UHC3_9ARAC|nr:hypothetical protein JTE90_001049 [Oedothorax gibbosus]
MAKPYLNKYSNKLEPRLSGLRHEPAGSLGEPYKRDGQLMPSATTENPTTGLKNRSSRQGGLSHAAGR